MKNVPRIGRVLDLVGLIIFAAGGVFFVRAWIGFRGVPDYVPPAESRPWAAVGVADGYWRLQKVGAGLMIAGIAVFVLAWWSARRIAARASLEEDGAPEA